MSHDHPDDAVRRERDPVCGMNARVDAALEDGLVAEHAGHTYYFCRAGCRDEFVADPARFITPSVSVGETSLDGKPIIDDGMRRWYESCSCCLSDTYPEVKAALDAERATNAVAEPSPGICEVAEAGDGSEAAQTPAVSPSAAASS